VLGAVPGSVVAVAEPGQGATAGCRDVVGETGLVPAPFSDYCYPLLRFASAGRFTYPYREWPGQASEQPA